MKKTISRGALLSYLVPLSLVFLGLPPLIFFLGWLRPALAWPVSALFVVTCIYVTIDERRSTAVPGKGEADPFPLMALLVTVFFAFFLLIQSGVGGYGPQSGDWIKHNMFLQDLMQKPWPAVYVFEEQLYPMVYYIAYYLPAALAGKLGGWDVANEVLFAWSLFGLVLALLWFQLLAGRFGIAVLVLFTLFSGLDVPGVIVRVAAGGDWSWTWLKTAVNWWAGNWLYGSPVDFIVWVPQMALGGWILAGLSLHAFLSGRCMRVGLLYFGLSLLWSPFLSIGILAYLAVGFCMEVFRDRTFDRRAWLPNACGAIVLALFVLYFASKYFSPAPPGGTPVHGWIFVSQVGDPEGWLHVLLMMIVFWLLEFGLYVLLLWRCAGMREGRYKVILLITTVTLLVLPLYRYGEYNDLVMRVSIPALFVLGVLVCRALFDTAISRRYRLLLVILLLIGALTPLFEFWRHTEIICRERTMDFRPDERSVSNLFAVHQYYARRYGIDGFAGQYLGSPNAPFFQFLAKEEVSRKAAK